MKIICLLLSVIIFNVSLLAQTPQENVTKPDNGILDDKTLVYVDISAQNLSLKAVDSYPQRLLKILRNEDSIKTVRISTFNSYEDKERNKIAKNVIYDPSRKYPSSIARFLKSTHYVNSCSSLTENIADTLFDGTEKRVWM